MKRFAFKVRIGAGPRWPSFEVFLILAGGIPLFPVILAETLLGGLLA